MTPKGILTKMSGRVFSATWGYPVRQKPFEGYEYKSSYIQDETQLKCAQWWFCETGALFTEGTTKCPEQEMRLNIKRKNTYQKQKLSRVLSLVNGEEKKIIGDARVSDW